MAIVHTLREAGYDALWAGGCVRDQLLGVIPKDYDVASTATPDQVISLFGRRKTIPVGASFGVVVVLGPTKAAGQIEVATFRSDGKYLDGRRPESVTFCRPEEDAQRRDFTINGMFFDPIANEVIDYVGGKDDLATGVIRAIGDPVARFTEDKLRLLRAVRFAATFQFRLEDRTADAVRQLHHELHQVSIERVAQELRRMLAHPTRAVSVRLLIETGLLAEVLPEIAVPEELESLDQNDSAKDKTLMRTLAALESGCFEPAMAVLLRNAQNEEMNDWRKRLVPVKAVCRRLKLSNVETDRICWLIGSMEIIGGIEHRPLFVRKLLLSHSDAALLLDVAAAVAKAAGHSPVDAEFCRRYLAQVSAETLVPIPLIDGRDIMNLGIPAGPEIRDLLIWIRNEQLDELLTTREQALVRLADLISRMR